MIRVVSCTFSQFCTDRSVAVNFARRIRSFLCDAAGSITVEFVVMVPVLLVALVFSFEFGRALWAYDVMTRDVRAATRFLSRDRGAAPPDAQAAFLRAQNVAETGSPSGSQKHFPWSIASAAFNITTPAKTGALTEYNSAVTVYRMSASLPLTLSFLEAIDNFLNSDVVTNNYTLVVTDEVRWVGE